MTLTDDELGRLAQEGFNWLRFLGVWKTGTATRRISQSSMGLQGKFNHSDFGDNVVLERLRARIHSDGMRLLVDFVPNHTAPDHQSARTHRQYYVGEPKSNSSRSCTITRGVELSVRCWHTERIRISPGGPDTLQLNYANLDLQNAMASELENIAELCDGVRCDMAMRVLPDIFEQTWGQRPDPFWPNAIARVRERHPDFLFVAEAYWDLEWILQEEGFDYTYDKRLYDRP